MRVQDSFTMGQKMAAQEGAHRPLVTGVTGTIPQAAPQIALKALVVTDNGEMVATFSSLLSRKRIETVAWALESAAIDRLSPETFEVIVVDFDKVSQCDDILRGVGGSNNHGFVIAVATQSDAKQSAGSFGTFVIERPINPLQIEELLRSRTRTTRSSGTSGWLSVCQFRSADTPTFSSG
jgi:CheY-like chemotaxis protein